MSCLRVKWLCHVTAVVPITAVLLSHTQQQAQQVSKKYWKISVSFYRMQKVTWQKGKIHLNFIRIFFCLFLVWISSEICKTILRQVVFQQTVCQFVCFLSVSCDFLNITIDHECYARGILGSANLGGRETKLSWKFSISLRTFCEQLTKSEVQKSSRFTIRRKVTITPHGCGPGGSTRSINTLSHRIKGVARFSRSFQSNQSWKFLAQIVLIIQSKYWIV